MFLIHSKEVRKIERAEIFDRIIEERARQDKLHPLPKPKKDDNEEIKTFLTLINTTELLAVLREEVGEIGKAIQGEGDLREELIQTCAVCVKWLEHIK